MNTEVKNKKLSAWITEVAAMCLPDAIYICDGSKNEYDAMMQKLIDSGSATPLKKRPNSYLFRSDPSDVARVEDRTYISTTSQDEAGPTNNWITPAELKKTMKDLYKGCMKGRTLYVIPFSMGPIGSPISKIGIEISDSPYVVVNMHIMTRVSSKVLDLLGTDGDFIPCLHSIGAPLEKGQQDVQWPCAPIEQKFISHFPEENLIWSYGSGYGGNALLGKKMPGAPHCLCHGAQRGMDGRTYADPAAHQPGRKAVSYSRGVPFSLRQDQSCHDAAVPEGLEM